MKLLNIETPVTRNFIPQILLNVQDFYFHKVGYTSYDEGIFGPYTNLSSCVSTSAAARGSDSSHHHAPAVFALTANRP
jgi:hypothetical protein